MSITPMTLSPIGQVVLDPEGFAVRVDEPYRAALRGVEGFSHLQVLWWLSLADQPDLRRTFDVERPYRQAPDRLGVFATRAPVRPNPIALSTVPVTSVNAASGVIRVGYLDAEHGSPVVDIKPYHPCTDRVREVSVPSWCAHWPQWYEDSGPFDWSAEFTFPH